jgi:hypothetical protein
MWLGDASAKQASIHAVRYENTPKPHWPPPPVITAKGGPKEARISVGVPYALLTTSGLSVRTQKTNVNIYLQC